MIEQEDFEDAWTEVALLTVQDTWAERVLLGVASSPSDLIDTWREIAAPAMPGAMLTDTWSERATLDDFTDRWREVPNVMPAFSEDIQRPAGHVAEEA